MEELKQIREAVEETLGVKIDKTRNRSVVEAKAIFCYLAHRFTNFKLKEIAKGVDLSNHATAYHHIKSTQAMIGIYPKHAEIVELCEAKLISLGMNVDVKKDVKKRYELAKKMLQKWSQEVEKLEKELFGEINNQEKK